MPEEQFGIRIDIQNREQDLIGANTEAILHDFLTLFFI